MEHSFRKLLGVSLLILGELAFAGGAKKPKVEAFLPINEANYKKRIIAIDDFVAKQIFQNTADGENIENQMFRQYLDLLIQSGRYSIRFRDDKGQGTLARLANGDLAVKRDAKRALVAENLKCDFYDEQFLFKGYVTSFELESSKGFKAGLSPTLGLVGIGAGFGFTAKKAKMTVNMQAADGYKERILASAESDAQQSERSFNFNLSYQQLASIGYDSYSKTPLSDVSKAALVSGINRLSKQLEPMAWQGRVLSTDGKEIVLLNAGVDVGLKEGDEVDVMHFAPQEDPKCRKMPIGTKYGKPGMPLGRFRIYQTEQTFSWAELVQRQSTAPLLSGSKVRISKAVVVPPSEE